MRSILARGRVIGHKVTDESYLDDMFGIVGDVIDDCQATAEVRYDKNEKVYTLVLEIPCQDRKDAKDLLHELWVAETQRMIDRIRSRGDTKDLEEGFNLYCKKQRKTTQFGFNSEDWAFSCKECGDGYQLHK